MKMGSMLKKSLIALLPISLGLGVLLGAAKKPVEEVSGYSASSLPTTIDLNDTSAANIRSYYSTLNNLSTSERQGTNLLKNLKTILKNGQKYYSYENGENVWKMYEITDRDWDKSPASSISGYNSSTKKITEYSYNSSDPYIHALYVNRDVNNQTTAWSDHQQTQWGINREHVWPKAEGFDTSGAGGARGDPRHLMAGNGYANNIHSNYYYGYVKSSGATDCGSKYSNLSGNLKGTSKTLNSGTVFEPQDSDKGDIARSIFYMVARYNYLSGSDSDGIDANNPNLALTQDITDWSSSGYTSSTSRQGKLGVLTDLLAWHHADPVDEYEIHRNNLLYTNFTNNRNPFIDFPEWVDCIWGTATYNGTTYQSYSSTPTGYATPSSDTINGYNSGGSSDPVSVTGVSLNLNSTSIAVGSSEVLTATVSPSNATNKGVSWTSSNNSVATVSSSGRVSAVAEGSATITVTTTDGSFTDTCAVTVTASSGGGGQSQTSNVVFELGEDGEASHSDGSAATEYTEEQSDVTLSISDGVNLYTSARDAMGNAGFKIGTSKADGSFSIDLSDVSDLSEVIIRASNYKANTGATVSINGGVATTLTKQSNDGQYDEISYPITSETSLSVEFSARAMVNEIEFVFVTQSTRTLSSITLDTEDVKTAFFEWDTFNYEGLGVTAYYDDSTEDIVVPTTVSTPNFSTTGTKTVTVSYTEGDVTKTATYQITVANPTLSSITVENEKTSYYVGDDFVAPSVTATYNNSATEDVSSLATYSGYNMNNSGNQTVTVSFTRNGTTKTTSYQITVASVSIESISVTGYTTDFILGDSFSFGGTVYANYNNGVSSDITNSCEFSGYNMSSIGSQTVTVSYLTYSTSYEILVSPQSDKITYVATIYPTDFVTTSYDANNGTHNITATNSSDNSDTKTISITSSQVMQQSSLMQWKKNVGYIYNSTSFGTITSIVINSSEGTFYTSYGDSALSSYSNSNSGSAPAEFFNISVGSATGKITSIVITFEYTAPITYTLVTNVSDLGTGDEIIFVANRYSNYYSVGSFSAQNLYFSESNITVSQNVATINDSTTTFKLTKNNSSYSFLSSDSKYIGANVSTKMILEDQITSDCQFSLSIANSGQITMTVNNLAFRFNYNSGTNMRFTCYSNQSYGLAASIYKKTTQIEADTWSSDFLEDTYNCNTSNWSTLASSYVGLSAGAKAEILICPAIDDSNYCKRSQAMARYEYILSRYQGLTNFIAGRNVSSANQTILPSIFGKNSATIVVLVLVSVVSASTIGGYFFLRSRKKEN